MLVDQTLAAGDVTNTVTTSSDTIDEDTSNNGGSEVTTITRDADLSIDKQAAPATATAGNQLTYTLTVDNNGPSSAAR